MGFGALGVFNSLDCNRGGLGKLARELRRDYIVIINLNAGLLDRVLNRSLHEANGCFFAVSDNINRKRALNLDLHSVRDFLIKGHWDFIICAKHNALLAEDLAEGAVAYIIGYLVAFVILDLDDLGASDSNCAPLAGNISG